MRYMLLMVDDGESDTLDGVDPRLEGWLARLADRGIEHHGSRLRPKAEAVTVRVRDGRVLVTDGPFAETKEQVCGFEIVECADLDEALDVAGTHPTAQDHQIEIRPFWVD
jgi:hypothetical protein